MRLHLPRYWYLLLIPPMMPYAGMAMNALVMALNGGQMPVLYPGGCGNYPDDADLIHVCMTHASHLKLLCDWIVVQMGIASPGDMLIFFGEYFSIPALFAWVMMIWHDHAREQSARSDKSATQSDSRT